MLTSIIISAVISSFLCLIIIRAQPALFFLFCLIACGHSFDLDLDFVTVNTLKLIMDPYLFFLDVSKIWSLPSGEIFFHLVHPFQ